MFLKNYTEVSDRKLIGQLNGNLDYQFLCDISLGIDILTLQTTTKKNKK